MEEIITKEIARNKILLVHGYRYGRFDYIDSFVPQNFYSQKTRVAFFYLIQIFELENIPEEQKKIINKAFSHWFIYIKKKRNELSQVQQIKKELIHTNLPKLPGVLPPSTTNKDGWR